MPDTTLLPFSLPAIKLKKVIAAFDCGRLSLDRGVALLVLAEKRVGIIGRLARLFPDERDQEQVTHPLDSMPGVRIFAIRCGYEDGNDLDHLLKEPAFKLASGRLPHSGHDLCSQPTPSAPGPGAIYVGNSRSLIMMRENRIGHDRSFACPRACPIATSATRPIPTSCNTHSEN